MELNWTTFLLEIINFLVLVWILKRFLYRPVLEVIARRRASIDEQLAEAHRVRTEAKDLKSRYQGRLADWEEERRKARDQLAQEIDQERSRQLNALTKTLADEREKNRVAQEKQAEEFRRKIEHRAMQQSSTFASRILAQASGPELESRLLELVLSDLEELPAEKRDVLQRQLGQLTEGIQITSAYPLSDEQRQRLEKTLCQVTGQTLPCHYAQDKALLAGLHITIGAWVLACNVRDELQGFAEFAHVSR